MKVCVADDHASVRAALHQTLAIDLGVEQIVEASTGEEAVTVATRGDVSLVLMDIHMPGAGGVVATQQIRALAPRVRVVALTAARDAGSVAAMIAAGADSYLVKTAPPAELRTSLRAILDGQTVLAPEVLPLVVSELASRLRTERERADALDALDRTKREFVSLVSDQLRNPLTVISGYTKTLRSGWERVDDATRREFIDSIDEQTEQLTRRIEQILTVARLAAGERTSTAPVALDAVVREVVDQCSDALQGRELRTRLEPLEVVGDRRALNEVLCGLVDNAIVHGKGAITLRVHGEDREAVVEVEDEGEGADLSRLASRLGEPFRPGDSSDTRAHHGLGLTLYIAGRVLAAVGGRLEFDGGPGRRTVARVRLPLASDEELEGWWSRGESNP